MKVRVALQLLKCDLKEEKKTNLELFIFKFSLFHVKYKRSKERDCVKNEA